MKSSMLVSIGVLLSSGAFLLMSLNYANAVGLFQIKSTLPAQFFANQMEAIIDGIYSVPEDVTIRYSGPNTCYWDQNISEWRCLGGLRIKSVGATASFTHTSVTMGFPFTGCLYVNLGEIILQRVKPRIKKYFRIRKEVMQESEEIMLVENTVEEALEDIIKKNADDFAEVGIKNIDDAISKWEKYVIDDSGLDEGLRQSLKKQLREDLGKTERTALTEDFESFLNDLTSRKIGRKVKKLIAANADIHLALRTNYLGNLKIVEEISEKGLKDKIIEFLKKGYVKAKDVTGKLLGYSSRMSVWEKRIRYGIKAATEYASCRSENPLLDMIDLMMNGQIILESDNKLIHQFYDKYIGKTGAISLKYEYGGEEREINKLFGLNGQDMCFIRKFLGYNLTDYDFMNFEVKNGAIELHKNMGLFETLCDKDDRYYPTSLYDIVKVIYEVDNDGKTRTLNIFVNPSKMIVKEGNKICEKRVKRTVNGDYNGEFTIYCHEFDGLTGDDFNISINYTDPSKEYIENLEKAGQGGGAYDLIKNEKGNEYWFARAPEVYGRFKIDSPAYTLAQLAGLGVPDDIWGFDYEVNTKLIYPESSVPRKEVYFQSRYDFYQLKIEKTVNGIKLTPIYIGMILGMDYNGIYTEAQLK